MRRIGRQPGVERRAVTRDACACAPAAQLGVARREGREPGVERGRVERAGHSPSSGAARLRALSRRLGERHRGLRAPLGRRVARVRSEDGHERQQHRSDDRQPAIVLAACRARRRVLLVLGDPVCHEQRRQQRRPDPSGIRLKRSGSSNGTTIATSNVRQEANGVSPDVLDHLPSRHRWARQRPRRPAREARVRSSSTSVPRPRALRLTSSGRNFADGLLTQGCSRESLHVRTPLPVLGSRGRMGRQSFTTERSG